MTSILSRQKLVFIEINSNKVFSQTHNILSIFFSISDIYIKFRTFWKKDEAYSWSISKVIEGKKRR